VTHISTLEGAARRWSREARALTQRPHRVENGKKTVEFFTNGHFFLGVFVLKSQLELVPGDRWQKQIAIALTSASKVPLRQLPLSKLRLVADVVPPDTWPECDSCEGSGQAMRECEDCGGDHVCVCSLCDEGHVTSPCTIASIDGHGFDRRYLAEVCQLFAGTDVVKVSLGIDPTGDRDDTWLVVTGCDRIAMIMSLRIDSEDKVVRKLELEEAK